jgi:hypothetical protein
LRAALPWVTGSCGDGVGMACTEDVTTCGVGVGAATGAETVEAAGIDGGGSALGSSGFGVAETVAGGRTAAFRAVIV